MNQLTFFYNQVKVILKSMFSNGREIARFFRILTSIIQILNMKSLILTAALLAATFTTAKGQSINFITDCQINSKVIVLMQTTSHHAGSDEKAIAVGSYCPTQEMPRFRLEEGNYSVDYLPIKDSETWFLTVTKGGEIIEKKQLYRNGFNVVLQEDMTILVTVAYKPMMQVRN